MKQLLPWIIVLVVAGIAAYFFLFQEAAETGPDLNDPKLIANIEYSCSYCHAMPKSSSIPLDLWHHEIKRAYSFIKASDIDQSRVPDMEITLAYFESDAPEEFEIWKSPSDYVASPLEFAPRNLEQLQSGIPGISNIQILERMNKQPEVILSDMRNGLLWSKSLSDYNSPLQPLGKVKHPARVAVADFNQDGVQEMVVADLGSMATVNDTVGALWLMSYDVKTKQYELDALMINCGRVADARPADFDGDGDVDLVVAEFGGQKNGGIFILTNESEKNKKPKFKKTKIDDRTGIIHVPTCDINGDGKTDFMALISQENEKIVVFINQGDGTFESETVYDSENPGYGSNGIKLVDMDNDSDLDVVFINGDTLDFQIYRPYHQIQWLENEGSFPFTHHSIMKFAGGMAVDAADLDNDGDIDLVAGAFLPFSIRNPGTFEDELKENPAPSLVWIEQTKPGEFEPHVLESGLYSHAAVTCYDLDGDGDQDILTGNFSLEGTMEKAIPMGPFKSLITIWENKLK